MATPNYPYVDFVGIKSAAYGMKIPDGAEASVDRLIAKAGERLEARVPRLQQRVKRGSITRELVAGVIEDMVIRVVRNPHGFSQEQVGEFMYRIDRAVASGAVHVTEEEMTLLLDSETSGLAIGNIRSTVPAWRLP